MRPFFDTGSKSFWKDIFEIMETTTATTTDVCAELEQIESWHIPRPTLTPARGSLTSLGSSSTNSTHSARSGSLLLTAANLALIHQIQRPDISSNSRINDNLQYYVSSGNEQSLGDSLRKEKDADSVSIASSTHFTVVNVNSRPSVRKRSFCRKHQLTVLVVSMSILFLGGILAAILFMELRARKQQM